MLVFFGDAGWRMPLPRRSVSTSSCQRLSPAPFSLSVTLEHSLVELGRHGLEPAGITQGAGITGKGGICQSGALISD